MRKLTLKMAFFASLLTLLLSGCAEEKFTLAGTEWHAEYTQTSGEHNVTYKDYIKIKFDADKINVEALKVNGTTYSEEGFVNYTYDEKTSILKLKDAYTAKKSGGSTLNPPVTIQNLESVVFVLSLDGKQAVRDGIKVTKDTKELDLNFKRPTSRDFKLKKVK